VRRIYPLLLVVAALAACGEGTPASGPDAGSRAKSAGEVSLDPALIARERSKAKTPDQAASTRAQVVNAVPPGQAAEAEVLGSSSKGDTARAQTDDQIRRDLKLFQTYLSTIPPATGKVAKVISSGEAMAPFDAPQIVTEVISAANQIARTPYRWGGGHSAWRDKGYDCSGSISFALAAAGLLNAPLTSGLFAKWGAAGPGRWITIYANGGHAFMTVAGLRFDTSGLRAGTRWQKQPRSTAGFVVRHPPGL
jgi:cell wall-associated NlpC family hydrolase